MTTSLDQRAGEPRSRTHLLSHPRGALELASQAGATSQPAPVSAGLPRESSAWGGGAHEQHGVHTEGPSGPGRPGPRKQEETPLLPGRQQVFTEPAGRPPALVLTAHGADPAAGPALGFTSPRNRHFCRLRKTKDAPSVPHLPLHPRLVLNPIQAALPGPRPPETFLFRVGALLDPPFCTEMETWRVVSRQMTPDRGWNLMSTLHLVASPGAGMRRPQS